MKTKINTVSIFIQRLIAIFVPLFTTSYVTKNLGVDNVGMLGYSNSIVNYFIVFSSLGISTYFQKEISQNQNNLKVIKLLYWNSKALSLFFGLIGLVAYIFFVSFFITNDRTIFYFLSLQFVGLVLDSSFLFQGCGDFTFVNRTNIIAKIAYAFLVVLLVKYPKDVYTYAILTSILSTVSNAPAFIVATLKIGKIPISSINPFKYLKNVVFLFIPTIAVNMYTYLDKTMIGLITKNNYESGYYEIASLFPYSLLPLLLSYCTATSPEIGSLYSHEKKTEIKAVVNKGISLILLFSIPACVGLISISKLFIGVYLGEGYDKVDTLLSILSLLIVIIGLSGTVCNQYLIPTNKGKVYTQAAIIGLLSNLIMNIFLIQKYASIGAAIASIISELVVLIVMLISVNDIISYKKQLVIFIKCLFSSIVMFFVIQIIQKEVSNNFASLLLSIVLGIIAYCISMVLISKNKVKGFFNEFKA